ncbi:hypothetical protein Aeh1ORF051c [Aeromonas phage Aeh1]|uniref:Uncharacterized protein n=1 Tax=Aeromonas phage Aeh1 TaxID=2880362 RepID=Q76Z36_9CAUD|nr:hypothetical protein Aeh1p055 [Aeromonas phage Aeh1]AAQ17710.1 hypothetical protein Aeh1ORF051c [Aeromonas phage Aeh1]
MFILESKEKAEKKELNPGDVVRLKFRDMTLIDFNPETKIARFHVFMNDLKLIAEYEHVMGDKWANGQYVESTGIFIQCDKLWVTGRKQSTSEIAIGRQFPLRISRTDGKPERLTVRFVGFIAGAQITGGYFQYSSFASNAMSDAMMFVGTTGRVYIYNYAGDWYRHDDGSMKRIDATHIDITAKLKWEA